MSIKIRRIVTSHTSVGKSVFLRNEEPERVVSFDHLPGAMLIELWATDECPILPAPPGDPTITMASFVPGPGGTRFRIVRFPPAHEISNALLNGFNTAAFQQEFRAKAPGLAETHEADESGMHTTDTIDYDIVLAGELWLELDNGSEVHLKPGDCVIQNGTRHAWRNHGTEPCIMASVLIGAIREQG
jgi:mannose-6-phosphate isomerase-like protein (cupin superfamily)